MGAPKQKWTSEEEDALRAGVRKHGAGKWRTIQKDPEFSPVLSSRSNIDLKVSSPASAPPLPIYLAAMELAVRVPISYLSDPLASRLVPTSRDVSYTSRDVSYRRVLLSVWVISPCISPSQPLCWLCGGFRMLSGPPAAVSSVVR
jgi:hypothetical protein